MQTEMNGYGITWSIDPSFDTKYGDRITFSDDISLIRWRSEQRLFLDGEHIGWYLCLMIASPHKHRFIIPIPLSLTVDSIHLREKNGYNVMIFGHLEEAVDFYIANREVICPD